MPLNSYPYSVSDGKCLEHVYKFVPDRLIDLDSLNDRNIYYLVVLHAYHHVSLTVKDSGTTGVIDGSNAYAGIQMTVNSSDTDETKKATLVVMSGTIQGFYYGISGNGKRHNTEVTVAGGTVKGTNADNSFGIYNPQNGKLTITGGVVEGASGVGVKSGTVSFIGGDAVIRATRSSAAPYKYQSSGIECTGDALVIDNCGYPGSEGFNVSISGGTFESAAGKAVASYVKQDDPTKTGDYPRIEHFIPGGQFSNIVPENLCAVGYVPVYVKEGDYYGVTPGTFVAHITTWAEKNGFTNLAEAVAAAQDNDTITLDTDVALDETVSVAATGNAIVLDLNGFVVSNATAMTGSSLFEVTGGTLTLTNGDLTAYGIVAAKVSFTDVLPIL